MQAGITAELGSVAPCRVLLLCRRRPGKAKTPEGAGLRQAETAGRRWRVLAMRHGRDVAAESVCLDESVSSCSVQVSVQRYQHHGNLPAPGAERYEPPKTRLF